MDFRVTIAILNWNGLFHLQQFLPEVVECSPQAHILLIDNASTDESVEWVKAHFPEIEILIHPTNLGFTQGYNLAIQQVKTEFCLLLNSDVKVSPGWLSPLIQKMEENPKMAACQPKILSLNQPDFFEYAGASGGFADFLGYPFCRGRLFDFCERDNGQYEDSIPVLWATGACMMVRTSLFREFGGLEPRFFAHMEEIDLCWRWNSAGYSVYVVPKSKVYHLGAGTLAKSHPRKTFLNFRNGLALLFCNQIQSSMIWIFPLRLILDGLAGIQFLFKGQWANCWAIVKAHFDFYSQLNYWRHKRKQNKSQTKNLISSELIFNGSVVWHFFVLGKRKFNELMG